MTTEITSSPSNNPPPPPSFDRDSLRLQLTELNNRSPWYASQLWQVPFAYLGLTGAAIIAGLDKSTKYLPSIFIACSIFGLCVAIHVHGVTDGIKRAVKH